MDTVVAKVHMAIDHAFSASSAAVSAAPATATAAASAPPGVSGKNDGESHPGDVAQVRMGDVQMDRQKKEKVQPHSFWVRARWTISL